LPKGATYELGGLYQQQQIAFHGLMIVFAAAAMLVFVLLLFMYGSFRLAATILVTALLAVSAVFIGLLVTHTELNITAMMGLTMVIGIVAEIAIFYFSEVELLRRTGPLATTSANRHGEHPAGTAAEVAAALNGEIDAIVDGGRCGGLPSTIIDCTTTTPRVLRDGPISATALLSLLGGFPASTTEGQRSQ